MPLVTSVAVPKHLDMDPNTTFWLTESGSESYIVSKSFKSMFSKILRNNYLIDKKHRYYFFERGGLIDEVLETRGEGGDMMGEEGMREGRRENWDVDGGEGEWGAEGEGGKIDGRK